MGESTLISNTASPEVLARTGTRTSLMPGESRRSREAPSGKSSLSLLNPSRTITSWSRLLRMSMGMLPDRLVRVIRWRLGGWMAATVLRTIWDPTAR